MKEIETDYLVVGAGASGMAFVDALIAESDAEVVMVDRRHRPGGHWVDAYPFVRIHQTSACYGVNSRVLGNDRIDTSGPNAGFYERSTAAEICDYYNRVLEEHLLPSGQVRFYGMSDYLGNGSDGHRFASLLTGGTTTVKVRRKLVDTTYTEGTIPSTHTPAFEVDDGVQFVTPNDLVNLGDGSSGFTVLGAGKTAMDTCNWLLDQGVAADDIRWVRPRDVWAIDRARMQPRELVASVVETQSRFIEVAAEAESQHDGFHRLEAHGIFKRLDPDVEPDVFRGATLSELEFEALRQIDDVVRLGRVRRLATDRVILDDGSVSADPGRVYVDCTASALNPAPVRPIFEADRITTQLVTFGIVPWSAATLGYVEATRDDEEEKNGLCPPIPPAGEVSDPPYTLYLALKAPATRMAESDVAAWNESSRLNPMRGAVDHFDDPRVQEGFARMAKYMEPALANLERRIAEMEALAPAGR
jgi:hypothetical protein